MDLSFLQNVQLEAVKKTAPKAKEAVSKLPETADIRVFGNGKVYPSEAFAAKHGLEFVPRVDGKAVGNGLDIFSSKDWGMLIGRLPQELIFITVVPKELAKVDMWASTKYDENNQPKASVFTQGASVFSKESLVPMIADVYGVNWDLVEYVDMTMSVDNVISSPNGVYHLPKVVSTGALKGEATYIRRENLTICPLVITYTAIKQSGEVKAPDMFAGQDEAPETDGAGFTEEDREEVGVSSIEEAIAEDAKAVDPGADWAAGLGNLS
jgi:hypothetical protein